MSFLVNERVVHLKWRAIGRVIQIRGRDVQFVIEEYWPPSTCPWALLVVTWVKQGELKRIEDVKLS